MPSRKPEPHHTKHAKLDHDTLERDYDAPIRKQRAREAELVGTLSRHDIDIDTRHRAYQSLKRVRELLGVIGRERNVFLRQHGIDFKYRVV